MPTSDPLRDALTFSGLVPPIVGLLIYLLGVALMLWVLIWQVAKSRRDKAAWRDARDREQAIAMAKYQAELTAWHAAHPGEAPPSS